MDGERSLFLLTRYRSTFTKSSNYNRRISKFHLSPSRLFQFFFFSFFPTRLPLHRQPYRTIRIRNMEPVTRSRSQPSVHPRPRKNRSQSVRSETVSKTSNRNARSRTPGANPLRNTFNLLQKPRRNPARCEAKGRRERERESDASGRSVTPSRLWRGGRGMKGRR